MSAKEKPPKKDALNKIETELNQTLADLQRTRADFENYRKRSELEKEHLKEMAKAATVLRLLPVVDNIDRALAHLPDHLQDDHWAKSVVSLQKNVDKSLETLGVKRIHSPPGTPFDPHYHEAIHMDEGEGKYEVIAEELQSGYMLHDTVIRHSLVRVKRVNELNKKEK